MIIDDLPLLASPTSTDELPIERGTTTYKATLDSLLSKFVYAVNDTLTFAGYSVACGGLLANYGKSVYFDVVLPKSLENISTITVTEMNGMIRGVLGTLDSRSASVDYTTLADHTVTVTRLGSQGYVGNRIRVAVTKTTAYTNATNNTPITYYGSLRLKFT